MSNMKNNILLIIKMFEGLSITIIVFFFYIMLMNIIKLFLSILLFIINLKQENNRIMSVELCLNYQVSICCIIHSISYFFFPVDEEGMVARIQGCIDMTMDITILYIIASICFTLLVFYNDPEKEEQRKTYMLIMTLISWLIPISFGVLAFFKGNVTKNYASYFSWHSVGYFNFIFSGYFWAALIAGFIFIAMLYFKVRGNTANENFKTYNFTIKLYFITLFISIFIYCYDLIVKYLLNSEHPFFEYFGCVVENVVMLSFCFIFGFGMNKWKKLKEMIDGKQGTIQNPDAIEISETLVGN